MIRPRDRGRVQRLVEDVAPDRLDAVQNSLRRATTDCHLVPTHIWIAQSSGDIVAAISVTMETDRVASVHDLVVKPGWAGTLLPALLIVAALEDGRSRGGLRARLDREIAAIAGLCVLLDHLERAAVDHIDSNPPVHADDGSGAALHDRWLSTSDRFWPARIRR